MVPNRPPRAPNRQKKGGIESPDQYGSPLCHPSPWRLLGIPSRPHFPPNFVNCVVKSNRNWEMLGCRSGHISQLRPNPLPECCRSRRVSTEDFNLTPIGGRNDQNHQGPLSKPPKISKITNDAPQVPRPHPTWALGKCVLYFVQLCKTSPRGLVIPFLGQCCRIVAVE